MESQVGELLLRQKLTLSIAESCTAGGICSRICMSPGSSSYFMGGIVCYSTKSKVRDLSITEEDINIYSEVSSEIAERMAIGVREKFQTDIGIATTGYTGPDGKKVGQVFIALSNTRSTIVKEYMFPGERKMVCDHAVEAALEMLLSEIK
mgnify:CR=1 FL=1